VMSQPDYVTIAIPTLSENAQQLSDLERSDAPTSAARAWHCVYATAFSAKPSPSIAVRMLAVILGGGQAG